MAPVPAFAPDEQRRLFARVSGLVDPNLNNGVSWSASAGTITADGLYTALAEPGSYTVTLTSAHNPNRSWIAPITVACSQPALRAAFAQAEQSCSIATVTFDRRFTALDVSGLACAGACASLQDGDVACEGGGYDNAISVAPVVAGASASAESSQSSTVVETDSGLTVARPAARRRDDQRGRRPVLQRRGRQCPEGQVRRGDRRRRVRDLRRFRRSPATRTRSSTSSARASRCSGRKADHHVLRPVRRPRTRKLPAQRRSPFGPWTRPAPRTSRSTSPCPRHDGAALPDPRHAGRPAARRCQPSRELAPAPPRGQDRSHPGAHGTVRKPSIQGWTAQ